MEKHDNHKCKYCGEVMNYYFTIRDNNEMTTKWGQNIEGEIHVYAYSYGNKYRVDVRCPKPFCNKISIFEYDDNLNYIGEI